MKKIILFGAAMMLTSPAFAEDDFAGPQAKCFVRFVEDGVKEVKMFNFQCDNYGKDATFTSKSDRFYALAFSEESCSPVILLHDKKTNTASYAVGLDESGNRKTTGFDVFKDKIVTARMEIDVKREEVLMGNSKNFAEIACSTDEAQLNELLED